MTRAVIHSDGASLGNPGNAGIGVHILIGTKSIEISEYIGLNTNNVAEYSALIRGLEEANRLGIDKVEAFLDSELVVKQLKGEYKIKNKGLMPYFMKARKLMGAFKSFKISHIPREQNTRADKLSKLGAKNSPETAQDLPSTEGQQGLPY